MLRYVYNGQEKYQQRYGNNKEYCMKMYSHFNYNGLNDRNYPFTWIYLSSIFRPLLFSM